MWRAVISGFGFALGVWAFVILLRNVRRAPAWFFSSIAWVDRKMTAGMEKFYARFPHADADGTPVGFRRRP